MNIVWSPWLWRKFASSFSEHDSRSIECSEESTFRTWTSWLAESWYACGEILLALGMCIFGESNDALWLGLLRDATYSVSICAYENVSGRSWQIFYIKFYWLVLQIFLGFWLRLNIDSSDRFILLTFSSSCPLFSLGPSYRLKILLLGEVAFSSTRFELSLYNSCPFNY